MFYPFTIYYSPSTNSEWLSSGEAGFDVVPPFDPVTFAQQPAEQDDSSVAQRREVYQSARLILELDAERFKLAGAREEFDEERDVLRAVCHPASALFCSFGRALGGLRVRKQPPMSALNAQENSSHRGDQGVGFLDTKELHKTGVGDQNVASQLSDN